MDTYRVSIVRETGSGSDYETETVFEVAGSIGLVLKVAPGALSDALRIAGEQENVPGAAGLAERVMDSAAATGAPVVPSSHPFQGDQPAKRTRRTKAQVAADKEAEGLGYRDAAHRAEVESTQQQAAPAVPAEPEQVAAPVAVESLNTNQGAGDGSSVAGLQAGVPAAPYNPFEVK